MTEYFVGETVRVPAGQFALADLADKVGTITEVDSIGWCVKVDIDGSPHWLRNATVEPAEPPMHNWAGQEIKVGTTVARGAREGNTSAFKVGRVIKLNHEKKTARVDWDREAGYRRKPKPGTCGIDSLFKIDPATLNFPLEVME